MDLEKLKTLSSTFPHILEALVKNMGKAKRTKLRKAFEDNYPKEFGRWYTAEVRSIKIRMVKPEPNISGKKLHNFQVIIPVGYNYRAKLSRNPRNHKITRIAYVLDFITKDTIDVIAFSRRSVKTYGSKTK